MQLVYSSGSILKPSAVDFPFVSINVLENSSKSTLHGDNVLNSVTS